LTQNFPSFFHNGPKVSSFYSSLLMLRQLFALQVWSTPPKLSQVLRSRFRKGNFLKDPSFDNLCFFPNPHYVSKEGVPSHSSSPEVRAKFSPLHPGSPLNIHFLVSFESFDPCFIERSNCSCPLPLLVHSLRRANFPFSSFGERSGSLDSFPSGERVSPSPPLARCV